MGERGWSSRGRGANRRGERFARAAAAVLTQTHLAELPVLPLAQFLERDVALAVVVAVLVASGAVAALVQAGEAVIRLAPTATRRAGHDGSTAESRPGTTRRAGERSRARRRRDERGARECFHARLRSCRGGRLAACSGERACRVRASRDEQPQGPQNLAGGVAAPVFRARFWSAGRGRLISLENSRPALRP
jgi:hypothetical protein